ALSRCTSSPFTLTIRALFFELNFWSIVKPRISLIPKKKNSHPYYPCHPWFNAVCVDKAFCNTPGSSRKFREVQWERLLVSAGKAQTRSISPRHRTNVLPRFHPSRVSRAARRASPCRTKHRSRCIKVAKWVLDSVERRAHQPLA